MIVLRVLSYNGTPADGPQAQFDELGGTIGRADNNQLVLSDPERTISRVHARVLFRAGGYAVVDNGSNPISVNGLTVGPGREQPQCHPGCCRRAGLSIYRSRSNRSTPARCWPRSRERGSQGRSRP